MKNHKGQGLRVETYLGSIRCTPVLVIQSFAWSGITSVLILVPGTRYCSWYLEFWHLVPGTPGTWYTRYLVL